jgi:DNA (cytosine-5)-methyltransferase 1
MIAYYNEIDLGAAATLRELIKQGHIAPGVVDTRSIEDVLPNDLRDFTQCHFFAGIGVWSYALRRAGWADNRRVWTASCPCQPFSAAGKGGGFDDERHLWPNLHYLTSVLRPGILLGEQVASHGAVPWLDLVQTDMEALAYAFGAVAFPSAGVGAPHIRDRTYWLAHPAGQGPQGGEPPGQRLEPQLAPAKRAGEVSGLDDSSGLGRGEGRDGDYPGHVGQQLDANGAAVWLEYTQGDGREQRRAQSSRGRLVGGRSPHGVVIDADTGAGPTNGLWAHADWLLCRDGKWRPVEPGTFPLAHGAAARVGRLRGYGNAINAAAAQAFIEAVM